MSFIPKKRPEVYPLKTLNVVLTICVNFLFNCSNFSDRSQKMNWKKQFFYKFFTRIFSILVGRFFDTLTFFVNRQSKCSNSNTDEQILLFQKKTYSSTKSASRSADCSCDNPERYFPTKGLLDQTPKKCEKFEKIEKLFKKCFSTKTSINT